MSESRWVKQTRLHDPANGVKGNCTQAAIASIMNLPLDDVPNFIELTDDVLEFWESVEKFVTGRGYSFKYLNTGARPDEYYLAIGPTVRGTNHIVVMQGERLKHDPHPDDTGILEINYVIQVKPLL